MCSCLPSAKSKGRHKIYHYSRPGHIPNSYMELHSTSPELDNLCTYLHHSILPDVSTQKLHALTKLMGLYNPNYMDHHLILCHRNPISLPSYDLS